MSIPGKDASAWAGRSPPSPQRPHAPLETRTENITFIVHDQLYKRNVPTWAHVRGPFHERALEKARERARKRGQLGGVHEGHSVSHLAQGLHPVPAVSSHSGLSRPTAGRDPVGGQCWVAGLSPLPASSPPGMGAAGAESAEWDLG